MDTKETATIYRTVRCSNGCDCAAVVPEKNWIQKLVDTSSTDGNWMILIHGMHMHTFAFCSLQCIIEWLGMRAETV